MNSLDPVKQKMPPYAKASLLFIAIYAFVYILYVGQEIILPILFSALFAVLLNPLVVFLHKRKVPRIIAIALSIGIAFLILAMLIYFIGSQVGMFGEKFPVLEKRFAEITREAINWVSHTFHITKPKINQWISRTRSEFLADGSSLIGSTLSTITGMLILMILIPIYIFMMIYYEPLFIEFIKRAFPKSNHAKVSEVILESKSAMQNYLVGLMLEALIVAILNSVGLIIIDIQYAILLGIIGALLNIIPYIGGIIAVALPMLMALVTKDAPSAPFLVMGVYVIVQFIDNHFIIPVVVASKVKINAFVSVVAVLIGGALWGIPGMFLSIPLTAIIKITCDRVHVLKPYGYLLGDSMPESDTKFFSFGRKRTVAVTEKKQPQQ